MVFKLLLLLLVCKRSLTYMSVSIIFAKIMEL